MGTLHEDVSTFITVSRLILLRMKNISDKSCTENEDIHFMFDNFFFSKNYALNDTTWKNMAEPDRPNMAI